MKKYCEDCENVFDESELSGCEFHIYNLTGDNLKTIVTKSGLKKIEMGLFCKYCLQIKHKHTNQGGWI